VAPGVSSFFRRLRTKRKAAPAPIRASAPTPPTTPPTIAPVLLLPPELPPPPPSGVGPEEVEVVGVEKGLSDCDEDDPLVNEVVEDVEVDVVEVVEVLVVVVVMEAGWLSMLMIRVDSKHRYMDFTGEPAQMKVPHAGNSDD
jgi:hypothetical protein